VEGNGGEVTMGGEVIPKVNKFKYYGSVIEKKGDINYDTNHRIRVGWQKWGMRLECYVTRKFL